MNFANLHMHSCYSDGNFTPMQLISVGKSLGYKALALTDHETDGGVPEFAEEAAKTYNLYRPGGTDHTGALSGCEGELATPALHGISEEDFYIIKHRKIS